MGKSALKHFIGSDTIGGLGDGIQKLENERARLNQIVDDAVDEILKDEYGDQVEDAKIKYKHEIEQIRTSLYNKYNKELEFRVSRLKYIRDEVC